MQLEISKNDEQLQIVSAKENNARLWQAFLPSIMRGPFDTNRQRLNELKNKARLIKPFEYSPL